MAGTILAGQRLLAATLGMPGWTAFSLLNSWTNVGGGAVTAQYRVWPLTNEMEIIGQIQHSSTSGTSQIATLAVNPASQQSVPIKWITATNSFASTTTSYRLLAFANGVLEFDKLPTGTTVVEFGGVISLDA